MKDVEDLALDHTDIKIRIVEVSRYVSVTSQLSPHKPIHIVVGTTDRLQECIHDKKIDFSSTKYFGIIDSYRVHDIKEITKQSTVPHQIVVCASTWNTDFQRCSEAVTRDAVIVRHQRQNEGEDQNETFLDVVQEVDEVEEDKLKISLITALIKTPPPVVIVTEDDAESTLTLKHLLSRGISVASLTASSDGMKDVEGLGDGSVEVLVMSQTTKQIDSFPNVNHVIFMNLPDISHYRRLIALAARGSRSGLSTVLLEKGVDVGRLSDLGKYLKRWRQRVPRVLEISHDYGDRRPRRR